MFGSPPAWDGSIDPALLNSVGTQPDPDMSFLDDTSLDNQEHTAQLTPNLAIALNGAPELGDVDSSLFGGSDFGVPQELQPAEALSRLPMVPFTFQGFYVPFTTFGPQYDASVGWYFPAVFTKNNSLNPGEPVEQENPLRVTVGTESGPGEVEHVRGKKRKATGSVNDVPRKTRPKHDIVKGCVCKRHDDRIPRPKNAFILYRSFHSRSVINQHGNRHQIVSRILGQQWHNETDEVKERFRTLAAKEKEKHKELYPEYRFRPGGANDAKFGDPSCTCGAYEINFTAALKRGTADSSPSASIAN